MNAYHLWTALNGRQQEYLRAVYCCNQVAGGRRSGQPAARWIPYTADPQTGGPAALQLYLRNKGLVDSGTGRTFQSLAERGLLVCQHDAQRLAVHLTRAGQQAVRSATAEPAASRVLKEGSWQALVMAYLVDREGLPEHTRTWGNYGGLHWANWCGLNEHRRESLVSFREVPLASDRAAWLSCSSEIRMYITPAGRQFYKVEGRSYRLRYPDVFAPESVDE